MSRAAEDASPPIPSRLAIPHPDPTPLEGDVLRWAGELAAEGVFPSVDAMFARARDEGSTASRHRIERARAALRDRGSWERFLVAHPGVARETWAQKQARRDRAREATIAEAPPEPPKGEPGEFDAEARRQRQILRWARGLVARVTRERRGAMS